MRRLACLPTIRQVNQRFVGEKLLLLIKKTNRIPLLSFVILLLGLFQFLGVECGSPDDPPPPIQYTYTWQIDTLVFDIPDVRKPDNITVQCIWGSSSHDVWAVAESDIHDAQLWRYNGVRWAMVKGWPQLKRDEGGPYVNDLSAVAGYDSLNVFFFGSHRYNDSIKATVLKWNGSAWSDLPWLGNKSSLGGLVWGVKQSNGNLWTIASNGLVVKYENGVLSPEPRVTDYQLFGPVIAALNNGEVYLNAFRDSVFQDHYAGTLTKLFKRAITGVW